ncbi:MAG: acyl carrier protein [Candidatus Obscuribacterales bacterium]|nr:acyl carrier protein [Steroidobacteraceae bacterium]
MDAQVIGPEVAGVPQLFDLPTIERWLISHVAALIEDDPLTIDITLPFSAYALDSVATAGLTADLEDWLGRDLPATLIWDYPSIELLARYLALRDAA